MSSIPKRPYGRGFMGGRLNLNEMRGIYCGPSVDGQNDQFPPRPDENISSTVNDDDERLTGTDLTVLRSLDETHTPAPSSNSTPQPED